MLHQADAYTLSSNPQFASLYRDLCKTKLNSDGSTKDTDVRSVRSNDVFAEDFEQARVKAARRDIVRDAIHHVAYHGNELPDELQLVVLIVSAQLDGRLEPEDQDIADGQTEDFLKSIKEIACHVSNHLIQNATFLATLACTDGHGKGSDQLTVRLKDIAMDVDRSRKGLNDSRIALSNTTSKTLLLYQILLETSIRRLEQVIHGSVARGTRTQAEYLAHVAEGLDKKLRIMDMQVMQQVYSPDIKEAFKTKEQEFVREHAGLKRRVRDLEAMQEEYDGVKGMRAMAETYVGVRREIERVKSEIERLDSR